jgi:pyridinium-3,5-biscarboxylic acid mononucleotide synthase
MDQTQLRELLERVRAGETDVDAAVGRLRHMPFENIGFANVDHHRALRHGVPEVIFGLGKAPEHVVEIALRLQSNASNLLITRASKECAAMVLAAIPEAEHFPLSGCIRIWKDKSMLGRGKIPVAEEARVTAEVMGNEVFSIYDVGVAGIHRLMSNREKLMEAKVLVVCAGMEGALPSAIGGLVSVPVIAVPTSIGYGAAFHGLAAMLGMLTSCASNVTVVNIDNGFGGAYVASLINRP